MSLFSHVTPDDAGADGPHDEGTNDPDHSHQRRPTIEVVLIRYYQQMARPAFAVEAVLAGEPVSWLTQMVHQSSARGLAMTARVGLTVGPRRLEHEVTLTVAEPRHLGNTTVIPIAWKPADGASLLPSLDGDLEIAAMGPDQTQIALSARYEPPLGWVGAIADRALMRRVAEATVKDFLDQLAAGIEAVIAGGGVDPDQRPHKNGTIGPAA